MIRHRNNNRILLVRKLIFMILLLAFLLCGGSFVTAQNFGGIQSVCLVMEGLVEGTAFNQLAFDGMERAAEEFDLETTFVELSPQANSAASITSCINDDYDAVITVGFMMADATLAAAEENPHVYFIGVDQYVEDGPTNYVGIQFREDEAGFLVGAMAALMTESDTIAGVYGYEIPPVVRFRNGYEQGAHFINPEVEVLGVYIPDFVAPERGEAAAREFMENGADVIFGAGGWTGYGAILYAASEGVWVISVDQDDYDFLFDEGDVEGAEYLITSALKRVDNGVYQLLEIAASPDESAWVGGSNYILSAANEGIGFAPPHEADVPEAVTEQVSEILEGLRTGDIETGVDPETGELLEPA